MMSKLLPMLRCPRCASSGKGALKQEGGARLRCADCGAAYPIRDGLPILLTPEGDFLNVLTQGEAEHG